MKQKQYKYTILTPLLTPLILDYIYLKKYKKWLVLISSQKCKSKRTSVILSITYESNQCRYYTGISIEPNKWNTRNKRLRVKLNSLFLINKSLNNIKSVSESCYYELVNSGTHIDNDILKEKINEQLTPTPILNFYSFADEFLNDNKQYQENYFN